MDPSRAKRLVLWLSACLLAATPTAAGFHIDGVDPIETRTSSEGSWASFTVTTDGAQVALDGRIDGSGSHIAYGWAVFDSTGEQRFQTTVFGYTSPSGAHVELHALGQDVEHSDHAWSSGGFRTIQWGSGLDEPGTYTFVVWTAGVFRSWTWTLSGEPGVSVGDVLEGDRTFLYTSSNFTGPVNVQSYGVGAGLRFQSNTSIDLHVEDQLFGAFQKAGSPGNPNALNELAVTGPDEARRTCPCAFGSWDGSEGDGSGSYTFHHTGVGVEAGFMPPPEVLVAGADARLAR